MTEPVSSPGLKCSQCQVVKDPVDFHSNASNSRGRSYRCKECTSRDKAARTADQNRQVALWTRYRLTVEAYEKMLADQGGRCAICEKVEEYRHWSIDHDHSCCPGRRSCGSCVRALLCSPCNMGLGQFQDNPDTLQRAADYLRRYNDAVH